MICHRRSRPRYEPTPDQIAVACERIQAGWNDNVRIRRRPRLNDGRVPWEVPVVLSIVDARGEYAVILQER